MSRKNNASGSGSSKYPMPSYELYKPHIRAGHRFVVLKPGSKEPLHKDWRNHLNVETALYYMKRGNNLGIILSATDLIVDVDHRNFRKIGGVMHDSLAALSEYIGYDFELAPRVRTGGGGSHIYFRKPAPLRIIGKHRLFPGVEYKTEGQQVVAAGSRHPVTKKLYRIDRDPFIDELWMAPDAPQALLDLITKPVAKTTDELCGTHTPEQLASMLKAIDPRDFRDPEKWLKFMMACHHATGGEGEDEFADWSTDDPQYWDHGATIRRRWQSLEPEKVQGVSYKTLYKELHKRKKDYLIPPLTSAEEDFEAVDLDELQAYL